MDTGDAYVSAKIADELACAFVRLSGNPRVMLEIKITDGSHRKFDEYRLAVVFFDGQAEIDFCLCEAFDRITMKSSPPVVSFSFEDDCISGVVWHGQVNEGTGVIGKFLKTNKVVVRVYFDDYSFRDFAVDAPMLASLKQGVTSDILHL